MTFKNSYLYIMLLDDVPSQNALTLYGSGVQRSSKASRASHIVSTRHGGAEVASGIQAREVARSSCCAKHTEAPEVVVLASALQTRLSQRLADGFSPRCWREPAVHWLIWSRVSVRLEMSMQPWTLQRAHVLDVVNRPSACMFIIHVSGSALLAPVAGREAHQEGP